MHLGYNKRPKIRDAEGNVIGNGDMAFNFGKKNPLNGGIDFANLPPVIYYLEGNIFPTGHTETISVWGAHFNSGTTMDIAGCNIINQFYISPFHIIIVIETSLIVSSPVIIVNNGVSATFKNLLKVQIGEKIIYTENDFALQDIYLDDTDLIKSSMAVMPARATFLPKFSINENFDIYFRVQPDALEVVPNDLTSSIIGIRSVTVPSQFEGVIWRVFTDGRFQPADGRVMVDGLPKKFLRDEFDHLFNIRCYQGKIEIYVDYIQIAEASRDYIDHEIEFITELYHNRVVDLEIFKS